MNTDKVTAAHNLLKILLSGCDADYGQLPDDAFEVLQAIEQTLAEAANQQ